MKTKNTLVVSAFTILLIAACGKKTCTPPLTPESSSTANASVNKERPQKIYLLDKSAVLNMVTSFKEQVKSRNNATQNARLSSSDSLSIDSAQFLIEATLNYDFDYNDQYTFLRDSKSYDFSKSLNFSATSGKLKTSDLEVAYNLFYDSIQTKVNSDSKVKVVDISVEVAAGGTILFKANPIIQIHSTSNPGNWNCATYGGLANGIGFDPTPLEKQLKYCNFTNPYNCYTYFLTNVTTFTYQLSPFQGSVPTTGIYRKDYITGGFSGPDITNIPLAYMNNYANSCTSYVNSNTPSISGIKLYNVMVWHNTINTGPPSNLTSSSWWSLTGSFGLPILISAAGC